MLECQQCTELGCGMCESNFQMRLPLNPFNPDFSVREAECVSMPKCDCDPTNEYYMEKTGMCILVENCTEAKNATQNINNNTCGKYFYLTHHRLQRWICLSQNNSILFEI